MKKDRTLKHGWKRVAHVEKMARKAAFRGQLEVRYAADTRIRDRLDTFVAYWKALRARKGVGRPHNATLAELST